MSAEVKVSFCLKFLQFCAKSNQFSIFFQPVFEIESSVELGRFLVASQRIPAGSVILTDKPLVASAVDSEEDEDEDNDSALKCLGCFKPRTAIMAICTRCGWPVCTESCAQVSE